MIIKEIKRFKLFGNSMVIALSAITLTLVIDTATNCNMLVAENVCNQAKSVNELNDEEQYL